jgi:hypothetical protein
MKKIEKIIIKHIPDYDTDLSWLGTFSNEKGEHAIEHSEGGRTYKYFNADNVENMKQARQNYEEMMKFERGESLMIGIKAQAEIRTSYNGKTWLCNAVSSGGLWGIEDSNEDDYIKEVEHEQLADIKDVLKELGFTDDEIANAPVESEA